MFSSSADEVFKISMIAYLARRPANRLRIGRNVSIKGVDDMVSIKGVDDMVPKATGKAQFLVIFCMYSFSLGHDSSPISSL